MNRDDETSTQAQICPVSHKIKAQFFLEEGRLVAVDKVLLKRLNDAPGALRFVLWHQLEIDELLIDGQQAQFTYGRGDFYREVVVEEEFLPDEEYVRLTVSYAGKPVSERHGVLRGAITPDIASLNPTAFPWYPHFYTLIDSIADVTFVVPAGYTVVAKSVCEKCRDGGATLRKKRRM